MIAWELDEGIAPRPNPQSIAETLMARIRSGVGKIFPKAEEGFGLSITIVTGKCVYERTTRGFENVLGNPVNQAIRVSKKFPQREDFSY